MYWLIFLLIIAVFMLITLIEVKLIVKTLNKYGVIAAGFIASGLAIIINLFLVVKTIQFLHFIRF